VTDAPAPEAPPPVRAVPPLLLAAASAGVAVVLALAALSGTVPLAVVVLLAQAGLAAAVPALLGTPSARGVLVLGVAAAVAADVSAVRGHGEVGPLAGVVALGLVAALLHQLASRDRQRVTAGLAGSLLVVVLACCAACAVALRAASGGRAAAVVALGGAAAALLVARLADAVAPRPALAPGRGAPGPVLGLAAAAAVAVLLGTLVSAAPADGGCALLGLAAGVGAVAADLLLARAPDADDPAPAGRALSLAVVLLPVAVVGPLVLVAGRLVLP
jgi:hypothetical protein